MIRRKIKTSQEIVGAERLTTKHWFGTLENGWRPFTERDYAIAKEMTDRLCAFAKNGDPNAKDYTLWAHGGASALAFGNECTEVKNPSMLGLWKTMLTNHAPGE